MKIEKIDVVSDGYIHCHSNFYSSGNGLNERDKFTFTTGVHRLIGEIDSGVWAISYLLSMYKYRKKDFVLFSDDRPSKVDIKINDSLNISIEELSKYSCYIDETIYPLFSTKATVRSLVTKGIKKNRLDHTPEEIREMFGLDEQRFERPLSHVGNERMAAMPAVGYCHGKQIFCFPWLSKKRFEGYYVRLEYMFELLRSLGMIVIAPIGK